MSDSSVASAPNASAVRRIGLIGLAAIVVLGGIAWGAYSYLVTRNAESTDDAYVNSDIVQVTSEMAGTVTALHADDTQNVKRDDVLVELDPSDVVIAMASAEAGLAQSARHVRALFAQADGLRAQIAAREAELARAQSDLKRRSALIASGAVSKEDFAHAQDNSTAQSAALDAARATLQETLAQISGTSVASHPDVLAAAARVRSAALGLRRTRILASIDGVVAKRGVQIGQHVDPGVPLMAVVSLRDIWIDANFKEVQLERMRVGQPVTVRTDIYGTDVVYHGKVAGLAAGSGGAFSLLPPQNATGNWIKIVQRLPVRILLDPKDVAAHPLRIGLSARVSVDVTDISGPMVAADVRNQPFPAKRNDADDPALTARIVKIIAENGGDMTLSGNGTR